MHLEAPVQHSNTQNLPYEGPGPTETQLSARLGSAPLQIDQRCQTVRVDPLDSRQIKHKGVASSGEVAGGCSLHFSSGWTV